MVKEKIRRNGSILDNCYKNRSLKRILRKSRYRDRGKLSEIDVMRVKGREGFNEKKISIDKRKSKIKIIEFVEKVVNEESFKIFCYLEMKLV